MKRTILFPVLCLFMAGLYASSGDVLTLDEAIASAMENNISLEIAQIELRQSLRNANVASSYIPDISIDGSFTASGSAMDSTGSLTAGGGIGISMALGTNLITDATAKSIERTLANLSYATTVDSLEESVITSYWNLSSSKNQIAVAENSLENAQDNYDAILESYDSGLKSELELANAQLAVAQAEYNLKALKDAYVLAEDEFRILTGLENEDIVLEDLPETVWLDLPSADELYNTYADGTNMIRTRSAQISQSETSLTTTKLNNQLPSVTLSAGWEMGPESTYISSWNGGMTDRASVTVAFSIPISNYIPSSSGYNAVENAKDSVAIAKLNLQDAEKTLLNNISSCLKTINQEKENLVLAGKKVEIAERTYDLGKDAYEAGLLSFSDFSDLEDSLFSTRISLVDAEYSYFNACNSLCFLLGIDYETLTDLYGEA